MPVENLLSPDVVRRLMWQPPTGAGDADGVAQFLLAHGARAWQVEQTRDLLHGALAADPAHDVTPDAVPKPG